mgnify:CR=1 FL=1
MVRLKGIKTPGQLGGATFQFLMVRLKEEKNWLKELVESSFQFLMVRLKVFGFWYLSF